MKKILLNWKHFWVENYQDYSKLLSLYPNIMLAPPAPLLVWFAERHPDQIVAQEITPHAFGAYTGALGPAYLKKIGVRYSIIGHQEQRLRAPRRSYIEEQYVSCCEQEIMPILCIGEQDKADYMVQISEQLLFLENHSLPISLAYEPLWAIGQQKHCSADHITAVSEFVRYRLSNAPINNFFYGGSILGFQPEILQHEALSGFLVGRLSLNLKDLTNFLKDYQQHIAEFDKL